jgi:aminoglycoside 6-adenylyltransferase
MSTFALETYERAWHSLFTCQELFREVSAEVAKKLGYSYPEYDKSMTEYTESLFLRYGFSE